MKRILLLGLLLFSTSYPHADDNWLIGKWQTDKMKTLAYLRTNQEADQDQLTYLEDHLTLMMMEFKEDTLIVGTDQQQYVHQYIVIEQTDSVIKLDVVGDDDPQKTFVRDGVEMYLITPFDVMDREYFRRTD